MSVACKGHCDAPVCLNPQCEGNFGRLRMKEETRPLRPVLLLRHFRFTDDFFLWHFFVLMHCISNMPVQRTMCPLEMRVYSFANANAMETQ
jgi:hypothetical protein